MPFLQLAIMPHRGQPLRQADGRVLEDGPDLDRELLLAALALPHAAVGKVAVARAVATGAATLAIRPPHRCDEPVRDVRVREVLHRFKQRVRGAVFIAVSALFSRHSRNTIRNGLGESSILLPKVECPRRTWRKFHATRCTFFHHRTTDRATRHRTFPTAPPGTLNRDSPRGHSRLSVPGPSAGR